MEVFPFGTRACEPRERYLFNEHGHILSERTDSTRLLQVGQCFEKYKRLRQGETGNSQTRCVSHDLQELNWEEFCYLHWNKFG